MEGQLHCTAEFPFKEIIGSVPKLTTWMTNDPSTYMVPTLSEKNVVYG